MPSNPSPMTKATRPTAPQPSPALLALQQKGFELSGSRNVSISPPFPLEVPDQSQRISPFSLTSTPSESSKRPSPLTINTRDDGSMRTSSAGSTCVLVNQILDLYLNGSQLSLDSEYEEITPCPDNSDEETEASIPTVHQPKAYRDTIAPLLDHQFSESNLTVRLTKSPQSFISLPRLPHPNANASTSSLDLTLDTSNINIDPEVNTSQTSIQATPDLSVAAPSFRQFSQNLVQRKIALDVPDVREADGWYNGPVSPDYPRDNADNRGSYESAATVISVGYERSMAYDMLAPPTAKKSPNLGPVSLVQGSPTPDCCSARIQEAVHRNKAPASREQLQNQIETATVEIVGQEPSGGSPEIQRPNTHLPNRPSVRLSIKSDDSFAIHDALKGHLKALWRFKFDRKEKMDQNTDQNHGTRSHLHDKAKISEPLVEDFESYKYPYNLHNRSRLSNSNDFLDRPNSLSTSRDTLASALVNQQTTEVPRDLRRQSPQFAVPPSRYQKYGPKIWHESKERKRQEGRDLNKIAATHITQISSAASSRQERSAGKSITRLIQERPSSLPTTRNRPSITDTNSAEFSIREKLRASAISQNYDDLIFVASGEKRKSGFASRILMSSEEKRKQKIKDSILVLGSARMSDGKMVNRSINTNVDEPLVRF